MKFLLPFITCAFLLSSNLLIASANEDFTLKRIQEFYKRRDFKEITNLASEYIRESDELSQDDNVIKFYFHTESDVTKLDSVLDKIRKNTDHLNSRFHALTYMLMEKALLGNQHEIGIKWGYLYRKEARSNKQKYIKGLYLYSCLLYKADKTIASLSVIDGALRERPNKRIRNKLKLLRISQLKNDFQIIVESKNFLKSNYDSTYADFIFANMIQAYRNAGKKRRVDQLKAEFKKDFGDSTLIDKVIGI